MQLKSDQSQHIQRSERGDAIHFLKHTTIAKMAQVAALGFLGGTWALAGYIHQLARERDEPTVEVIDPRPFMGAYTPQKMYANTDTRGLFKSVQEDVDVNGARIFLVDYGTGSRTVCYADPRVLY